MNHKLPNFLSFFVGSDEARHAKILKSLKARANARRTTAEKCADFVTEHAGSMGFLIANMLWFAAWICINTGLIPAVPVFDPFPFSLLTMIVSLEAIILATLVLISQNRAAKVDDIREETHLQINLIAEKEITKVLKLMTLLMEKHGIDLADDPELKKMLKPINEDEVEKTLEKEMNIDNIA